MTKFHLVLLAGLATGCGVTSHPSTPGEGIDAVEQLKMVASRHGASSCTPEVLNSFSPQFGAIESRTSRTARVQVTDVAQALEVDCGHRGPRRCFDEATAMAPLPGEGQRRIVRHRSVVRGQTATLLLDASKADKVYATTADMISDIRRLESEHQIVKVNAIGRAVDVDWSAVDIRVEDPPEVREVASVDLEWTHSPNSLRRLVEAVHVLDDELARADIVIVNKLAVFEQLGKRILASLPSQSRQRTDKDSLVLLGGISSNYPAIDDSRTEQPFAVTLRTRCRANFED